MPKHTLRAVVFVMASTLFGLNAVRAQSKEEPAQAKHEPEKPEHFKPEQQASKGTVKVGGNTISYDAYAGTMVVHPKGWDDVPQNVDKDEKNPAEAVCSTLQISSRAIPAGTGRLRSCTTEAQAPRRSGYIWGRLGRSE